MYVEENTQFQLKVVSKSGLDLDGTYLPPAIHPSIAPEPKTDMKTAMLEAEMVMGSSVASVLEKTGAHHAGWGGHWEPVGRRRAESPCAPNAGAQPKKRPQPPRWRDSRDYSPAAAARQGAMPHSGHASPHL
jgi:hypothetical protein